MWPTFVVLTLLDGALVHGLPISGDGESAVSGWLIGVFAGLVAIVILAPILGYGLRLLRQDMPAVVARDYAGTAAIAAITLILLAAGLAHRGTVTADRRALQDAIARAQAYIGVHAKPEFRNNLRQASAYELQPPMIYRVCVPNLSQTVTYCVVVHRDRPFGRGVAFAGYEPNSVLSEGTN
jgi:cytochrome bd-type quinol oxidase subunit 2